MLCGASGSTRVSQEAEQVRECVGKGPYCGFHGGKNG